MQVRDLLDDIPMSQDSVIPLEMKQLLREELNIAQDWEHAESLSQRAIEAMPDQLTTKFHPRITTKAKSNGINNAAPTLAAIKC